MSMVFKDRETAGQQLADALAVFRGRDDLIVLALPRGGVPVAYEVATALEAPLDLLIVRKLGVPWHSELAMGAIATDGVKVLNEDVIRGTGVTEAQIKAVTEREQAELARRERRYRGDRPTPELAGRIVILVDDGLATGATMRAAIDAAHRHLAKRVVVAVPVSPPDTTRRLSALADEMVCLSSPEPFYAISQWYARFDQTSDEEVCDLLARNWAVQDRKPSTRQGSTRSRSSGDGETSHGHAATSDSWEQPVASGDWPSFSDAFSHEHEGWLVTLGELKTERLMSNPEDARWNMDIRVRNQPLRWLRHEPPERRFVLAVGMTRERLRKFVIPGPVRVIEERQAQGARGLRIDREDGVTSLIEFRVAAREETLDGIAAGELG